MSNMSAFFNAFQSQVVECTLCNSQGTTRNKLVGKNSWFYYSPAIAEEHIATKSKIRSPLSDIHPTCEDFLFLSIAVKCWGLLCLRWYIAKELNNPLGNNFSKKLLLLHKFSPLTPFSKYFTNSINPKKFVWTPVDDLQRSKNLSNQLIGCSLSVVRLFFQLTL